MKFILKHIAKQFGNSRGFNGRISTFIMNYLDKKQYQSVIENINIQETDTILDIGFGNGHLIHKLLKEKLEKIYGIEISSDMINLVAKKNRKKIEQGKLQLRLGNVQNLPLENSSIDRAYKINFLCKKWFNKRSTTL